MQCMTRSNDKATTANGWTAPGTSVTGRYNTPPLREDLVPRSRMAPEGKTEKKEKKKRIESTREEERNDENDEN